MPNSGWQSDTVDKFRWRCLLVHKTIKNSWLKCFELLDFFPSFIFSLKMHHGRIIQQPTWLYVGFVYGLALYMGFCNACLFLSIAKGVTLLAVGVSGNNQWIPSQNKGANVVPSSWVNKQLLNKIFSTALHVCVNIVFPPWVIWSAALQLHGRGHPTPYSSLLKIEVLFQDIPLRISCKPQELHFLAGLEKKFRLENPDGHI